MEHLVSKWSDQVGQILRDDSSKLLPQNPTPFAELQYWEERATDLGCIYDQLNNKEIVRMSRKLEKSSPTHWPVFKLLFSNVVAALAEAQDIIVHLKPLKRHIEAVANSTFEEVGAFLRPLMHCVCLVWGHSEHYCHPKRIIVILREICNLLIEMARAFLGGSSLFQGEPEEGYSKCEAVVGVLRGFRRMYEGFKNRLNIFFPRGREIKHWDFLSGLVFDRFELFMTRIETLGVS